MYIANTIALRLGRGDGQSNFFEGKRLDGTELSDALDKAAAHIASSYNRSLDVTVEAIRSLLVAGLKLRFPRIAGALRFEPLARTQAKRRSS